MRLQTPPGERKSGMPDSVEIPAPVNTTARRASRSIAERVSMSRSNAVPPPVCIIDGTLFRRAFAVRGQPFRLEGRRRRQVAAMRVAAERHLAGVMHRRVVGQREMTLALHLLAAADHVGADALAHSLEVLH